jgi:hypothetical protein
MHDIGRTQLEAETEFGETEFGEMGYAGEFESSLGETAELELTSELLGVSNEQELEQFLGNLLSRAGGALRQFAGSPTGRALGGLLKDAARKALPAVGHAIGGPTGSQFATQAGQILGLELEGLSLEDREYEAARQYVRFATEAARAASAAPAGGSPLAAARAAAAAAASQHAPGLAPALGGPPPAGSPHASGGRGARSGRWVRRGNTIVLTGI